MRKWKEEISLQRVFAHSSSQMGMGDSLGNGKEKFSELMALQYYNLIMFLQAASLNNHYHYPEDEDDKISYRVNYAVSFAYPGCTGFTSPSKNS